MSVIADSCLLVQDCQQHQLGRIGSSQDDHQGKHKAVEFVVQEHSKHSAVHSREPQQGLPKVLLQLKAVCKLLVKWTTGCPCVQGISAAPIDLVP